MPILSVSDLSKSYGTNIILNKVSFHMEKGDRIGIVGPNGAGKTTLLSILAGELNADSGRIYLSGEETLGYLKQKNNSFSKTGIYEEMLAIFSDTIQKEKRFKEISLKIAKETQTAKDAQAIKESRGENLQTLLDEYNALALELENSHSYSYESQIKGMLSRMSFPEEYYHKEIATLSGGERTRLALAALLLQKPSILLLDEPTNHLDARTLTWLEQFLAGYGGSLIIVSHDRYFLDKTANRIFEIEDRTLTTFKGNYTQYALKKKALFEEKLKHYNLQAGEIARQEDLVRRLAQHKTEKLAKRAKSVQKRLDKMEKPQRPGLGKSKMSLQFKEKYTSGNDVLFVRDLAMKFGPPILFEKLNLHIRKGEKVCMVGANGSGKTTFLNILMEKISPFSGDFRLGQNVLRAYYDQQQALLQKDHTVMEEIHDDYRLYSEPEIRGFLGRFHFQQDDVFKKVEDLSGGERAKLSLLKLMLSGANFLIMDEPGNHLDIQSKEAFEDAILSFPGTVLMVSHDRYLLNKIPDRIVELTGNGLVEYPGNYDYYMEKKSLAEGQSSGSIKAGVSPLEGGGGTGGGGGGSGGGGVASPPGVSLEKAAKARARQEAKEEEASRRRLARDIEKAEDQIHLLEEEIVEIETLLCDEKVFSDLALSNKYSIELEKTKGLLEKAYNHWLDLKE